MAKLVAIAGFGDEAQPAGSGKMLLAWGIVLGAAVGLFAATLSINPKKRRR